MVKRRLLFITSLILLTSMVSAQDSLDSTRTGRVVIPSLYIDYGKLFTIPTDFETKYEGGIELMFLEKFPLIVEAGHATLTPEGAYANGVYESKGLYYRIGAGYIGQLLPKNKIGLTFRYAASSFSEDGEIFIESPSGAQNDFSQTIKREDLTATWYEVVVYSDRKLNDLLTIGIHLRFRILSSYDEQAPVDVYAIPGYGRAFDSTIPAMNFFLKVSF